MQGEKQKLFHDFINKKICSDEEIKIIKKYIDEEADIEDKKKYAMFLMSKDYNDIYYINNAKQYIDLENKIKECNTEENKKQIDIKISRGVIRCFINDENDLEIFLRKNSLSEEAFDYYVNLVKLENKALYNKYLNKIDFINKSNNALLILKARLLAHQIKDGNIKNLDIDEKRLHNLIENSKSSLTKEELKALRQLHHKKTK